MNPNLCEIAVQRTAADLLLPGASVLNRVRMPKRTISVVFRKSNPTPGPSRHQCDHIERLNAWGFVWDPIDEAWNAMYGKLVALKDTGRLAELGKRWPEDPKLGVWANTQRYKKKLGILTADRIGRLNAIGFPWSLREASWEQSYCNLVEYKSRCVFATPKKRTGANERGRRQCVFVTGNGRRRSCRSKDRA